ncbi:hypothetical protein BpHYR1_011450 [Brachionus plicatilis]|uniref:Uncharacterized protein n=1 Tax=Brachionus plicatilis TaxID=10195 RepID=A0A3M7QEF7_BRAPC|nr:hypothetical protein BpHYR1_011450 [Brachionus plicatilis]
MTLFPLSFFFFNSVVIVVIIATAFSSLCVFPDTIFDQLKLVVGNVSFCLLSITSTRLLNSEISTLRALKNSDKADIPNDYSFVIDL